MNNNDYVRLSLELHLFFCRIMKEHSLFLEVAFLEKDNNLKAVAKDFKDLFSNILNEVVDLSNGNISNDLLLSQEIVTKNTMEAENKTSMLSNATIDTNITKKELNLRGGSTNISQDVVNKVFAINNKTLNAVKNLIHFKTEILNSVLACKMFTSNYPLLIKHILQEAKMYHSLLSKIEERGFFTNKEILEQELFWNNIMMEHAQFIRGLLDPTEEELILTADNYAEEYKKIIQNYKTNSNLTNISLNETTKFRDFKIAGEEGILNCKIKSIIIPLLADHVVREANHFIRLLKSFNK